MFTRLLVHVQAILCICVHVCDMDCECVSVSMCVMWTVSVVLWLAVGELDSMREKAGQAFYADFQCTSATWKAPGLGLPILFPRSHQGAQDPCFSCG